MTPGFRLEITTWENDGDNYKTQVMQGLTAEQVSGLIWIASHFHRGNTHRQGKRQNEFNLCSNDENDARDMIAMYVKAVELYPSIASLIFGNATATPPTPTQEQIEAFEDYCELSWDDPQRRQFERNENPAAIWLDYIGEFNVELFGQTDQYFDYANFVRVFEKYKVYYVPGAIAEVTEEFPLPTFV